MADDKLESCFCPCLTLARNEEEILIRERQRVNLGIPNPNAVSQAYRAEPMISYPLSKTGGSSLIPIPEGKIEPAIAPSGTLPSIPEATRVVVPPPQANTNTPPVDKGFLFHLGSWWRPVGEAKENAPPGTTQETTKRGGSPWTASRDSSRQQINRVGRLTSSHSVEDDEKYTTRPTPGTANHGLEGDIKVPYNTYISRFTAHDLDNDQISPPEIPASMAAPHGLENDPFVVGNQRATRVHSLSSDAVPAQTVSKKSTIHNLDSHKPVPKTVQIQMPHDLETDQFLSGTTLVADTSHDLDADAVTNRPRRTLTMHSLSSHPVTSKAPAVVATHRLEDDEMAMGNKDVLPHGLADD